MCLWCRASVYLYFTPLLFFCYSFLPLSLFIPIFPSLVSVCVSICLCAYGQVCFCMCMHVCVLLECWPTRKEGERLPRHQRAGSWQGEEGLNVQWDDNGPRWTPGLYEKTAMWRKQHTHSYLLLNTFSLSSLCSYVPNTHIHTNPLKGLQSLSLVVMHVSVVLICFSQPPCTSPLHPNLISDLYTHRCLGLCPWTCVSSPVLWRALRPSTTSSLRCKRVSGGHVGVLGQKLYSSTTLCLKIPKNNLHPEDNEGLQGLDLRSIWTSLTTLKSRNNRLAWNVPGEKSWYPGS